MKPAVKNPQSIPSAVVDMLWGNRHLFFLLALFLRFFLKKRKCSNEILGNRGHQVTCAQTPAAWSGVVCLGL